MGKENLEGNKCTKEKRNGKPGPPIKNIKQMEKFFYRRSVWYLCFSP
jgi:hypothetical protein